MKVGDRVTLLQRGVDMDGSMYNCGLRAGIKGYVRGVLKNGALISARFASRDYNNLVFPWEIEVDEPLVKEKN